MYKGTKLYCTLNYNSKVFVWLGRSKLRCFIFVNSVDYNYVALNLKAIGIKIEAILSPQRLIYKQKIYIDYFTSATFQLGDGMVLCNSWGSQTVLRSQPHLCVY